MRMGQSANRQPSTTSLKNKNQSNSGSYAARPAIQHISTIINLGSLAHPQLRSFIKRGRQLFSGWITFIYSLMNTALHTDVLNSTGTQVRSVMAQLVRANN